MPVVKQPTEYDTFTSLVDRVLAVPHAVIQQRIEAERKRSAANPNRPGPKPKLKKRKAVKPSAS